MFKMTYNLSVVYLNLCLVCICVQVFGMRWLSSRVWLYISGVLLLVVKPVVFNCHFFANNLLVLPSYAGMFVTVWLQPKPIYNGL